MRLFFASALILSSVSTSCAQEARKPLTEFKINLDVDPEERFVEVIQHFNSSVQAFYEKFFAHDAPLRLAIRGLSAKRGAEVDELQAEIRGIAKYTGIPEYDIHAVQLLYELQTVMVPILNITVPWSGPGCTGIVAVNKQNGQVYHARNLDFSPAQLMQDLTYTGIFMRNGSEVFRAQMIAAYSSVVTGMKLGTNGFTFETNTRYLDHVGGNKQLLKNLFSEKRPLNGWTNRKILEMAADYEAAVADYSTAKYITTQYVIMAGAKKGTILARDPDGVAHRMVLGQENYDCRDDYIIVTNFDYYWHDIREWFDYTSRIGLGHSRRVNAMKIMNSTATLTPEALFATINDDGVAATDTIFQAVMSIDAGLWNVSLNPLFHKNTTMESSAVFV